MSKSINDDSPLDRVRKLAIQQVWRSGMPVHVTGRNGAWHFERADQDLLELLDDRMANDPSNDGVQHSSRSLESRAHKPRGSTP